jgi:hypothetical protein
LRIADSVDPDIATDCFLSHAELFEADKLEHGQESDNDLRAAGGIGKEFLKSERNAFLSHAKNVFYLI